MCWHEKLRHTLRHACRPRPESRAHHLVTHLLGKHTRDSFNMLRSNGAQKNQQHGRAVALLQ